MVGQLGLALFATVFIACAPPEPTRLLKPDFSIEPNWGTDGPFGVAHMQMDMTILIDRRARVEVFLPLETDTDLAQGAFVPVIFGQGGLVSAERYTQLATHITSWGHVVVIPHHVGDLALLESARMLEVLRQTRRLSEEGHPHLGGLIADRAAVAVGHSLGGVMAAQVWHDAPGEVGTLVLLASVPAFESASRDLPNAVEAGPVITLRGTRDGRLDEEDFIASLEAFGEKPVAVHIEGMNHMQWADDPTEAELADDGEATLSTEDALAQAFFFVDGALAAARGEDASELGNKAQWPPEAREVSAP
jgi:dienelactone hydrolase